MNSDNAPRGGAGRWVAPRPVDRLGKHGGRLWKALTGPHPDDASVALYVFRPDELAVLEGACHQTDRAAALLAEVKAAGSTMVVGSQGQPVIDGRLTEARLLEVAARQALAQLKLPDQPVTAAVDTSGVDRWSSPSATPGGDAATAEADRAAQVRRERAAKGAAARWHSKADEHG